MEHSNDDEAIFASREALSPNARALALPTAQQAAAVMRVGLERCGALETARVRARAILAWRAGRFAEVESLGFELVEAAHYQARREAQRVIDDALVAARNAREAEFRANAPFAIARIRARSGGR